MQLSCATGKPRLIVKKIMNKRTKSFLLAFLVSALFMLLTVVPSSSVFNILPYMLHETFLPGGASESVFIIGFDIVIGILLFFVVYKLTNRQLQSR
jgi:hypothetical protein